MNLDLSPLHPRIGKVTLPETNSEFTPENGCCWKTSLSFWGTAHFLGARPVSFREGIYHFFGGMTPLSS